MNYKLNGRRYFVKRDPLFGFYEATWQEQLPDGTWGREVAACGDCATDAVMKCDAAVQQGVQVRPGVLFAQP